MKRDKKRVRRVDRSNDSGGSKNKARGKEAGAPRRQEKRIRISDDLLWGIHPVVEGLRLEPERFGEIFLQKERHGNKIEEIVELARKHQVKLNFVEVIRLTGEEAGNIRHQGVVARLNSVALLGLDELEESMAERINGGEKVRLVVCDSLQDPHNLGAIIRSALGSGAAGVVITRDRSAPLGGTAAKSSAGAIAHMDIYQVTNLAETLKRLKKLGFWVFGAVKDQDAVSLYETDLNCSCCLVVGSEGKGIRPLVKKECDQHLFIPMQADIDSLNSSVAAAVLLFEAMRQSMVAS